MPIFGYHKQFADKVERGEKRQTIRISWKRWPEAGQTGYHYTGPYNDKRRKLGEWPILSVEPISLTDRFVVAGVKAITDQDDLNEFAIADGFGSWEEMCAYFINNGGLPASGLLIRW